MAGLKIIDDIIKKAWDDIDESFKDSLKAIIINFLPKFSEIDKSVFSKACDILAHIVVKQDNTNWTPFFELVFSTNPPNYFLLKEFIEYISIEVAKDSSETKDFISENIVPHLLSRIISDFPNYHTKKVLLEILKFTKYEQLQQNGYLDHILEINSPKNFQVLIYIGKYYPISLEQTKVILNLLNSIDIDEDYFCDVTELLSFRFDMIYDEDIFHELNDKLLSVSDFETNIDYWEYFVLKFYHIYQQEKSAQIIEKNGTLFGAIRDEIFRHMSNPPDLVFGLEDVSTKDEYFSDIFWKMKRIIKVMIELDSDGTLQSLVSLFEEVQNSEDNDDLFFSFVYSAAICHLVEGDFANSILEYISDQRLQTDNVPTLASFFYMAMHMIEREAIDDDAIDTICDMCLPYIQSPFVGRQVANLLLTIARKAPLVLAEKYSVEQYFMMNFRNDISIDISFVLTLIYAASERLDDLISVLSQNWDKITQNGISIDTLTSLKKFLCLLVGIADAEYEEIQSLVQEIVPNLEEITKECLQNILLIYEKKGESTKNNPDALLMLNIISLELRLFIDSEVLESLSIIEVCESLPVFLIPNGCLELCVKLISSDANEDVLLLIREGILNKIEEYMQQNEINTLQNEMICLSSRIIQRFAKYDIEYVTESDILFVLEIMKRSDESITFTSLQTLKTIIKKFSGHTESIAECFPTVIGNLIIKMLKFPYFDKNVLDLISANILLIMQMTEDKTVLSEAICEYVSDAKQNIDAQYLKDNLPKLTNVEEITDFIITFISTQKGLLKAEIEQKLEFQSIRNMLQ